MLSSQTEPSRSIERAESRPVIDQERRRIQRISLPLPVRIEAKIDGSSSWNEITRLIDVSAFGAGFNLKRPLKRGRMVLLTLPMPRQLRSFDYSEPQYRVWALVRRCVPINKLNKNTEFSVGVAFTGKNPPVGYVNNPAMLYDIAHRENDTDMSRVRGRHICLPA